MNTYKDIEELMREEVTRAKRNVLWFDRKRVSKAIYDYIEKNYVSREWHSHYKKSLDPHCTCDEPDGYPFQFQGIDEICLKCNKPIKPPKKGLSVEDLMKIAKEDWFFKRGYNQCLKDVRERLGI